MTAEEQPPAEPTPPAEPAAPDAPKVDCHTPRGVASAFGDRWKDKPSPLPYKPSDNIARGTYKDRISHPALASRLKLTKKLRDQDHASSVSKHLIDHYVAYRLDPSTDKLSQRARAAAIGCSVGTINKLEHIPEIYDEIRRARNMLNKEGLLAIDDAVLTTAVSGKRGSIDAARLYMERWDEGYMPKKASVNINAEINALAGKSAGELEAMAAEMLESIKQIRERVDAVAPAPKVVDAEVIDSTPNEEPTHVPQ